MLVYSYTIPVKELDNIYIDLATDIGTSFYDILTERVLPKKDEDELSELGVDINNSEAFRDLECKEDESIEALIRFIDILLIVFYICVLLVLWIGLIL